jgi:short-subunit dehydrogenase
MNCSVLDAGIEAARDQVKPRFVRAHVQHHIRVVACELGQLGTEYAHRREAGQRGSHGGWPIAEQPIERLRSMFEINVFSSIAMAQGFARAMVAKRQGKIVFISSMAGLWTLPYASGYSASKHALEAIAEGLKAELAQFGVKVATVNPGVYGTGFNDRGGDTISHWYDPAKNFTPPEVLEGMRAVLVHQLEPKAMADVIVDVVLSDTPKFRNVYPQETEDLIRQMEKDSWEATS